MARATARILVVEDETIIAMMIQDTLEDWGYIVVGPASRLPKALELVEQGGFDAAVLDVNIAGDLIYPVAKRLDEGKIPIVFLTGYGKSGIHSDYARHPALTKPIDPARLCKTLADLLPQQATGD
jgi:CheY-like chemotaxis protein